MTWCFPDVSHDSEGLPHVGNDVVRWHDLARELGHIREIIGDRSGAAQRALELQAREYERRLADLNHAHTQAVENWRQTLPRESFELFEREFSRWREMVALDLDRAKVKTDRVAEELRVETEKKAQDLRAANESANMVTRIIVGALALGVAVIQFFMRHIP